MSRRRTRTILEFDMYAPYRLPGASVRLVPFQAVMPPPHARFASVIFSNQLCVRNLSGRPGVSIGVRDSRSPEPEQIW